jgi:hypothetical protein
MLGRTRALTFVIWPALFSGCMTPPKNDADLAAVSARGTGTPSLGSTTKEDEEWSKMGRQMRGDAPAQQTFDPLRDILVSPRAQSIEHSLGVDN